MSDPGELLLGGVTAVAIGGRALLIEGVPGSGKSSLALALIDRGAVLIGDDGVRLDRNGEHLVANPPPHTAGLLEVRNIGLVTVNTTLAPVSLILQLDPAAPRFPEEVVSRTILGVQVPQLPFHPCDAVQAVRAEWALHLHGLI